MADIKIVVDTGSDIPADIAQKYDIGIIRFLTLFGEKTYVQGIDITNDEFFKKLKNLTDFQPHLRRHMPICMIF